MLASFDESLSPLSAANSDSSLFGPGSALVFVAALFESVASFSVLATAHKFGFSTFSTFGDQFVTPSNFASAVVLAHMNPAVSVFLSSASFDGSALTSPSSGDNDSAEGSGHNLPGSIFTSESSVLDVSSKFTLSFVESSVSPSANLSPGLLLDDSAQFS